MLPRSGYTSPAGWADLLTGNSKRNSRWRRPRAAPSCPTRRVLLPGLQLLSSQWIPAGGFGTTPLPLQKQIADARDTAREEAAAWRRGGRAGRLHTARSLRRLLPVASAASTGPQGCRATPVPGSVNQFSRSVVSDSLRPHGLQQARLPCPSPIPRAYSNSCPLRR